ncbi:hypothetical protein Syun_014881 [Stephania yunnanensis]|uniref:Reverse transcriptase domain-containing protein n=1 Tax=Stephania yunnanensis TaxID=152371 RepID=A0AAP0PCC3_9MAGN
MVQLDTCLYIYCYLKNLVEWESFSTIKSSRGLRDPLSPLLFLIVSERLSSLLHNHLQSNQLLGLRFSPSSPYLSFVFFLQMALYFLAKLLSGKQMF